ncbi:MAG: hypothetical protein JSR34_11700 [Proteobacteria bacterium]|nr:hypothetical protein [Pseudomonadota bacterium]
MNHGLLLQYLILGAILVACVLVVIAKLAPQTVNRWRAAASIRFSRKRDSRMAQMLAQRLQPRQATGNCADGCATCGACGPKKPAAMAPRRS